MSLVLASAKVADHVVDGDGAFGRRPVAAAARGVAARWAEQGGRTGGRLGFDTSVLTGAVAGQAAVERRLRPGDDVLLATEPTERATAAAFAHTAVLAGRPANGAPLAEASRLFGRIAHLLDAVEDLAADEENGAWNPLRATGTGLTEARRLCDDAVLGVTLALREVRFTEPALVHALLVHELEQAVRRTFGHAEMARKAPKDGDGGGCWLPRFRVPPRKRNAVAGCGVALYMCCSCQFCCRDPYPGPWSGKPRGTCDCDCGDCNRCDC